MNPTTRIRLAIILTAGMLLGVLIAAVLLLLRGSWRPGAVVISVIEQMHNGRQSVTWTLTTHTLIGIQVTASDPAYSGMWADRDMWRQGKHWDKISVTVCDKDGSFVLEYSARAKGRGSTLTLGGSRSVGSQAKTLVFTDLRRRGYAPPGAALGGFTLETQDGRTVKGKVSLIEVTDELLHPFNRPDANDGQEEEAD